MKNKVYIVIENGMVHSVYAGNKKLDVEIVDLDSQDEDESDAANDRLLEIESDKNLVEIETQ